MTDSGYNTYDAASGEMKVQPKTLVVTPIGGPSTKTIKTDTAFAEFTDLPAGQYIPSPWRMTIMRTPRWKARSTA